MEEIKWLEITLEARSEELDDLTARLTGNGVTGLVIEDEEETESQTSKKCDNDNFQRKVDRVTRYDRDYIWGLVHDQLRQVGLSQAASDYAMIYFDHRYQYALENMRFADRAETIAEYVFNGVLSEWTKVQRLKELKGGE